MDLLYALILGIMWGLGAAVPIGPVNSEIARRTLRSGFSKGAAVGLGAVTIDVGLCCLALLGVGVHLDRGSKLLEGITIVGAIVLTVMGVLTLVQGYRAYRRQKQHVESRIEVAPPENETISITTCYLTGLLMTLLSPWSYIFWFGVLPSLAAQGTLSIDRAAPFIILGVLAGTVGWVMSFTAILSRLKRFSTDNWIVIADALGGVILLGFAAMAVGSLVV